MSARKCELLFLPILLNLYKQASEVRKNVFSASAANAKIPWPTVGAPFPSVLSLLSLPPLVMGFLVAGCPQTQ